MIRRLPIAVAGALLAAGLVVACSSPGRSTSAVPSHPTEEEGSADASATAPPPAAVAAAEAPPPEVVRLDLAAWLHFAELRSEGGILCDLGSASGHPCTLGGHRTGWRGLEASGEPTFATMGRRRRATVHLHADDGAAARLLVRVHPAGAESLEVRLRGERVGMVTLDRRDDWTVAALDLPEGALQPGDNPVELRLRGPRERGRWPQVDWVWLPREAEEAPEPTWPTARVGEGPSVVTLPEGMTLGYYVVVPVGARLAARVGVGRGGSVEVSARALGESGPAVALGAARARAGESATLSASLADLEGQMVRLELSATGGDALLGEPAIRQASNPETAREPEEDRPTAHNLVVVLIDTLRADHLSSYNPGTRVRAEAFERFAASGVVFDAAQAQENWTKPSVATLLTGLYPTSHNAQSGEAILSPDVEMIGEILEGRGFATAAFIANGYVSDRFGFRQGWGTYRNYVRERRRNRAEFVVDDAIEWLDTRPDGQPFFLYVHTIDPHVPYIPPTRFRSLYDSEPYRGPIVASRTAQLLADIKVGRLRPSERDRFRLEALYDGEISYGDDHFGRLIAALEERGLLSDTVVWVTSDHGEEFFDHGSVGHGHSLYQELLHVPLVVSAPGVVPSETRVPDDVGLIDVLPTSLELLGLDPQEDLHGRSLVPLIAGERPQLYEAAFSDFLAGGRAARSGDLKVVVQGREISLFDLSSDPREQRDLSEGRPLALRYMLTLLSAYIGSSERSGSSRPSPRRVHRRHEEPIDPETLEQLRALGYML